MGKFFGSFIEFFISEVFTEIVFLAIEFRDKEDKICEVRGG